MEIQWALVLFTVISGTGAWLFAFSTIGWLAGKHAAPTKVETILSIVLLAVGGCASVLHLSHADRILEALNHPTSGIFIEAAMIGICCVVLAVYFIMLMRGAKGTALKVVAVVGMLLCAVFTYECGSSYMMSARPAWCTIALPLAYFGTAAAPGAGLNMLMKVQAKDEEGALSFAGLMAVVAGACGAVLAAAFCIFSASYLAEAGSAAMTWAVVLFLCLAAVIVCGAAAMKKPGNAMVLAVLALAFGVVAALALRVLMWVIGSPTMNFFLMALD